MCTYICIDWWSHLIVGETLMFDSKDFKQCWIKCVELYIPIHSSISNVTTSPPIGLTSWALLAHFKKDTSSPSVGSFHVKDQ